MNRPTRPSPSGNTPAGAPQRGTYSSGDGTCLTYRRRRAAPITGALIYALLFVLILLICIFVIARSRRDDTQTPDDSASVSGEVNTADTHNPANTADTSAPETAAPTVPEFETVTVPSASVSTGNLILINGEHPYVFPESQPQTVFYGNKSPVYVLSTVSISLNTELFPIFDGMIVDFSQASGCKNLLVTSGYRSYETQKDLYDSRVATQGAEAAAMYVALPGYSEHHAGLAVDMVIFEDGQQYYFPDYPDAAWLIEHAPDYGFFLRYTEESQPITKCAPEPWHYRYVGTPHARLITALGLCFEEYHDYLRAFSWEGERLLTDKDGNTSTHTGAVLPSGGYMIYRVEADSTKAETEIPVPRGLSYEISGDNAGGFIVTVTLPDAP